MAQNGRLPANDLAPIPGGRLRRDAAASWLRLRQKIGKETGTWICPTSTRTAYRTLAEQRYFWDLYTSGRGNLAARPGTSNHGWGVTVDVPTPAMRKAIDRYGAEYGWAKRWSDAPSEWWHLKYDPAHDRHKGEHVRPRKPDVAYLTDDEQRARRVLLRERRVAKKNGGWDKVDASHLERASAAKAQLRKQARLIRQAAKKDGWTKNHRRERYDAIRMLLT